MNVLTGNNLQHSLLSASGAHRWGECPASVVLMEQKGLVSSSGFPAREGTAMHEAVEEALSRGINAFDIEYLHIADTEGVKVKTPITDEQSIAIAAAMEYIQNINGHRLVEVRIHYGSILGVPKDLAYGTCDVLIVDGKTLHVIDEKFGRKYVGATNNQQMILYAAGALSELELVYPPFEKVHLHIIQPRVSKLGSVWETNPEEIIKRVEHLKPKAKRIIELVSGNIPPIVGDYSPGVLACEWCPASGMHCIAQRELAESATTEMFNALGSEINPYIEIEEEILSRGMQLKEILSSFFNAIEEQSFKVLMSGKNIPGYKLIQGRAGNMKWDDSDKALDALQNKLTDSDLFLKPVDLKTPTQVLAAVKKLKDKALLEDLEGVVSSVASRSPPAVKIVSEETPGEEYSTAAKLEDFSPV